MEAIAIFTATFGTITSTSLDLIGAKKTIGFPSTKTDTVSIPSSDVTLDLTEAFGGPYYNNRKITLEFLSLQPWSDQMEQDSTVKNALHGQKMKVVFSDDPDYYWLGRINVGDWTYYKGAGKVVITIDAEPYKYALTGDEYEWEADDYLTGDIVTLQTQGAYPLSSALVEIVPVQEGSGTPSPENVRPIQGWQKCNLNIPNSDYHQVEYIEGYSCKSFVDSGVSGANDNLRIETKLRFWDWAQYAAFYGNYINETTNVTRLIFYNYRYRLLICTNQKSQSSNSQYVDAGGWFNADVDHKITHSYSTLTVDGTDYALTVHTKGTANSTNIAINANRLDTTSNYSTKVRFYYFKIYDGDTLVKDLVPCVRISDSKTGLYDKVAGVFHPNIGSEEFVCGTDYESIPVTLSWKESAGTIYGGFLDAISGTLTVTYGNIDSYNGEDLPGAWISSMDVYAEGATPSIGAQVVYELATPQTYQLTSKQISTISGTNKFFSDTGSLKIPKPFIFIEDVEQEVIPTIECEAETTLTWDGNSVTIGAGESVVRELSLEVGDNEIGVKSSGDVVFSSKGKSL